MLEPEQPFNNTHDISWPTDLAEPEILARLVILNTQRHLEEQSGLIRWLRPESLCKRMAIEIKNRNFIMKGEES